MVKVIVFQEQLIQTLHWVNTAALLSNAQLNEVICEMNITESKIIFTIPGSTHEVASLNSGECRVAIELVVLVGIMESYNDEILTLEFTDDKMKIGTFERSVKTVFHGSKQMRSIHLPLNFTDIDLIVLPLLGYTSQEIEFNRLTKKIALAESNLQRNLSEAFQILTQYGIKYREIEKLVNDVIEKKVNSLKLE